MKTNHTAEKWVLKNSNPLDLRITKGENGPVICEITTTGLISDQDEAEANAKLIAAAPELLEALKLLIKEDIVVVSARSPHNVLSIKKAIEAIKKATE